MNAEKGARALSYVLHGGEQAHALLDAGRPSQFDDPPQAKLFKVLQDGLGGKFVPPTLREVLSLLDTEWTTAQVADLVRDSYKLDIEKIFEIPVTEATWTDIHEDIIRASIAELGASAAADGKAEMLKRLESTSSALTTLESPRFLSHEPVRDFTDFGYMTNLYNELSQPDLVPRVLTGYAGVDSINKGLYPGELAFILASSGCGKTMALGNMAYNMAINGYKVLYYDMECCEPIIRNRLYARITGEYTDSLDSPHAISRIMPQVAEWRYNLTGAYRYKQLEQTTTTISTFRHELETFIKNEYYPDVVVLDYGELLSPDKSMDQRRHNEEAVFRGLWATAQRYKVVIITATQANRTKLDAMATQNNPPEMTLADIAECYAKSHCASLVLGLYETRKDIERGLIRMKILKNRKGASGRVFAMNKKFSIALLEESTLSLDGSSVQPTLSMTPSGAFTSLPTSSDGGIVLPFPAMPNLVATTGDLPPGEKRHRTPNSFFK
jgi:replicative DNA helicase